MATFGAQSFAHFMTVIEQRGYEWQNQNYIFQVGMATWVNIWNTRFAGRRAGHDALNAIQTCERVRGKAESDNLARENHATETAAANGTVADAHNALIDSVERLRNCLANHVLNAHFDLWITRTRLTAENTLKEAQKTLTTIVDSLRAEFRKDDINAELFPDGQWSCVQVFTSGINTTGLWVRHTPTNMIEDRVVRKVEYKTQAAWDDDRCVARQNHMFTLFSYEAGLLMKSSARLTFTPITEAWAICMAYARSIKKGGFQCPSLG
ncbi:hypothetical protein CKM354_000581500 [Cercospora kikuchii]|uniref:Uncharacterized protein n=1 Tax=Cercospora kikuchii TaxID=84275 RepID=A0A9P3CQD4_9PEZI|nr:uncharacterized protein CKM354_000581500 [Cercospora kikuchii]GIZ42553.1 hypothetical protein CKM354_000581500 [Cercospora kikuchii]